MATFAFYMEFEQGRYEASWRVHLFAILAPILILKYVKDLDLKARIFILTILAWHIIDVLSFAIDDGYKNDLDYKCTHTASISNTEQTDGTRLSKSSTEKELMLNFSGQPTDEKKLLRESTLVNQSTDVL